MESRITGRTELLGIIGSPVRHSGSPVMYNYSFQKAGLDYAYLAFEITADQAGEAIKAMRTFKLRGMNVTMPCKRAVIEYLDELSVAARLSGAVNTIVNEKGRLTGYNTDGEGFIRNLKEHGFEIGGKRVVVLGAGGAATSIYVQAALDGAAGIVIFKRRDDRFEQTVRKTEEIMKAIPGCQITVQDMANNKALESCIAAADILINGTVVGMAPAPEQSPIKDKSMLRPGLTVADIVYNPRQTRLLQEAQAAGCKCIDGIGMLLWQGAAAFKLYTGYDMPVQEVQEQFFR